MRHRFGSATAGVAIAVIAVVGVLATGTSGQAPPQRGGAGAAPAAPARGGTATPAASTVPRMPDGKPNFTGLWKVLSSANYDIQDHSAAPGPYYQLGAIGATPAGQGIVEGNEIPYRPEMVAKKNDNYLNRWTRDPEIKCFMPGIPRATYMPFPFQIIQGNERISFAYEFATSNRVVRLVKHEAPAVPSWMGTGNAHWEGDSLVIEVTGLNDETWFDRAGNFHSDELKVVERYTFRNPDVIDYEATMTDPKIFTRPWKISLPIYRILDKNAHLLEFKCVEYAEDLVYGHLRRPIK